MKIGIITLNGFFNYGNRLQNYALQKSLEKIGFKAETIWETTPKKTIKSFSKIIFTINNKCKKARKLYLFSKNNIHTKYTFNINKIKNEYDYFICGSDQVWNPDFKSFNDKMFLSFSDKKKNISYAASFGINELNDKFIEKFKKGLNNFKAISVRENEGKKIINEIDKSLSPKVVVDPTLLLEKEEWEEIANKSKINKTNRFILLYMLGKLSLKQKIIIEKIAKENECEIINITDKNSKYYSCGVEEFLYLEKNAYLVCTDSFHSTVFSIIFETPFLVFERNDHYEKMNSRLNTLLKMTKLDKQYITNKNNNIKFDNIDFKTAHQIIKKERNDSLQFLKDELL